MYPYDPVSLTPVLRSRHIFGRLRLPKSEVPEPTPAPTRLGRLRLPTLKFVILSS